MSDDPTSLDRLHDVISPPTAPWWPLPPGWQILGGVAVVAIIVLLFRFFLRWQANRYRREALRLLDTGRISDSALGELLKRVALTAFGRERVASLNGPAWLEFLDHTGDTREFTSGSGRELEQLTYAPAGSVTIDPAALKAAVKQWIRNHQVKEDAP